LSQIVVGGGGGGITLFYPPGNSLKWLPGSGARYAVWERHERAVLHEADVAVHSGVELRRAGPRDSLHVDLSVTFTGPRQHMNAVVPNVWQAATQSIQVAEEQLGEVSLASQEQAVVDVQLEEATW